MEKVKAKVTPKVLVVCKGNICRSPVGEAILRHTAKSRGIKLSVKSAGTHSISEGHQGEKPCTRMIKACKKIGIDISRLSSTQLTESDMLVYSHILCMDNKNKKFVEAMKPDGEVHLFLDFADTTRKIVPDPYYLKQKDFQEVINLITKGAEGFLDYIEENQ